MNRHGSLYQVCIQVCARNRHHIKYAYTFAYITDTVTSCSPFALCGFTYWALSHLGTIAHIAILCMSHSGFMRRSVRARARQEIAERNSRRARGLHATVSRRGFPHAVPGQEQARGLHATISRRGFPHVMPDVRRPTPTRVGHRTSGLHLPARPVAVSQYILHHRG